MRQQDPWALRLSTTLYRRLLQLYPPAFRSQYGAPMLQLFQDVCRDAYQRGGSGAVLASWLPALADVLAGVVAEWLRWLHEQKGAATSSIQQTLFLIIGVVRRHPVLSIAGAGTSMLVAVLLAALMVVHVPIGAVAPRQLVEQRAVQYATNLGLRAVPSEVHTYTATRAEIGVNPQCASLWFQLRMRLRPSAYWQQLCDPDALLWLVQMKGDYGAAQPGGFVFVLMAQDGTLLEGGSYDFRGWHRMMAES